MRLATLNFVSDHRAVRGLVCAARRLASNEVQRSRKTSPGSVHG
jgi:hypothetical protein